MKLKINKWEFDITQDDWILDNGSIYQCPTLRHHSPSASMSNCYSAATVMSKKQFNSLIKEGKLIDATDEFLAKVSPNRFIGCKIWKFKIEE